MSRIYLAVPYSHPSPRIRDFRFVMANEAAALLICQGHHVFSPISHSHPIATAHELPKDFSFWHDFDLSFLTRWAEEVYLLELEDWDKSIGVQAELEYAKSFNLPITHISLEMFAGWRRSHG